MIASRSSVKALSFFFCGGLLGVVTAVSSEALSEGAQTDQIFLEQVEVSVVNVEVFVTDKRGNRVPNLTQEDFQVFEDGKPVEITNFYAVEGGGVRSSDLGAAAGGGEDFAPIEPKQLHLVVYVDDRNLSPANRNRALALLQDFVREQLRPTDRIMLVTSDGGLLIQQEMTADPDLLVAALQDMSQRGGKGALLELERRSIVRDIQSVQMPGGGTGAGTASSLSEDTTGDEALIVLEAIRNFAQREHNLVRDTIAGLRQFIGSLSGVPGRKAVLYVSDGLSMRPGEELYYAWDNKFREYARDLGVGSITMDATELRTDEYFEALVDAANASEVTFYALRAAGGGPGAAVTGETPAFVDMGGSPVWTPALDTIASANTGSPLRFMSDATGGFALVNSRNFDGMLDRMREDFDSYYSLGYTIDHTDDQQTHRIRVVVPEQTWSVRHRERYRHKTREEKTADLTLSALLLDIESNPLQIAVEFGEAEAAEKRGQIVVPVIVKVPIANLVLLPQGDFHVGQIKIAVVAKDGNGHFSPVRTIQVPVRIPNHKLLTALGQVAGYRVKLGLRRAKATIAVGVHDSLANVDSAVRVTYEPPASQ